VRPRPEWIFAIGKIKEFGLKTAAITNNWKSDKQEEHFISKYFNSYPGGPLFDVIIESSKVGIRKPDPRIYQLALNQLNLHPTKCIFLDDLGQNLRSAQELGMKTIRVPLRNHFSALEELQSLLPFPILDHKLFLAKL